MATIGILDSGVGGLSVLKEILKVLPDQNYIYYADSANCPYGPKSKEWVCQRTHQIAEFLIGRGAQAIVVACNTATAAAISDLRASWPDIPFVGMEPAVKPAALSSKSGIIGVLATKGTLRGSKYLDTKGKYSSEVTIIEHVGDGFVELVESGIPDPDLALQTVKASLTPLLDSGADRIVLGCTHYPFLQEYFTRIAPDGVQFIDPAPAVAKRLVSLLSERGLVTEHKPGSESNAEHHVTLLSSSSDTSVLELLYSQL